MIVFSEDKFSDTDLMFTLKDVYPDAVMISLPAVDMIQAGHEPDISTTAISGSLSRLILSIQHREYRWDN
jgi:hypothetical protein